MDKNDIELGKHYAIREHPDDDLQHVKILESVRSGKWRAEWINPNPGLVDYVASRHIIVPWGQRRALLRDERNAATMFASVDRGWSKVSATYRRRGDPRSGPRDKRCGGR